MSVVLFEFLIYHHSAQLWVAVINKFIKNTMQSLKKTYIVTDKIMLFELTCNSNTPRSICSAFNGINVTFVMEYTSTPPGK